MDENEKPKRLRDSTYFKISAYALSTICISILFYYLINNFANVASIFNKIVSVITPFLVGGVIAYLLNPLLSFIERYLKKLITHKGVLRGVSLFLTFLFTAFLLWALLAIVLPEVGESITELGSIAKDYIQYFTSWLASWLTNWFASSSWTDYLTEAQVNEVTKYISGALNGILDFASKVIPQLMEFTGSLTSFVFNGFLGIIVSIYLLLDKEKLIGQIKKTLFALMASEKAERLVRFGRLCDSVFSDFVVGELVDSAIVGVLCFICMSIVGMPYALLISLLVAVTNIIPYFGPFIGAIPAVLILLTVSPAYALGFVIMILIIQQVDGNIIKPLILADSTGLSGIWILVSVTVGGGLFGILGMVLGVPICAILYTCFISWGNRRLEKKGASTNIIDYIVTPEEKDARRKEKKQKRADKRYKPKRKPKTPILPKPSPKKKKKK